MTNTGRGGGKHQSALIPFLYDEDFIIQTVVFLLYFTNLLSSG